MQKKTKIILFIVAIVGIIIVVGTIAYLTNRDATNNNEIPDYAENLVLNKTQESSKQNVKPALDIKVGDTINYSPSGTYILDNEYATSGTTGTTTLSSSSGESYNLTTWRVLSVDKDAGKIEMVPTVPTTGKIRLRGAQGYNNAVIY